MSSVGAVLTGVSIACILAGVVLIVAQVRRRPAHVVAPPSGNGSAPPTPSAGGGASRRRRILYALLVAMLATLAAAVVVQDRLAWGIHLLVDDAFLGYVAWLARRAEQRRRSRTLGGEPEDREGGQLQGGGEVEPVAGLLHRLH